MAWGVFMSFTFEKIFSRRVVVCYLLVAVMSFSCILRVASVSVSDYSSVAKQQSSYRLSVGRLRGTIYDCNMMPITNSTKKIYAAVSPTPRAITAISSVLSGESLENVLTGLKSGKPVLCQVPEVINCNGIQCTEVYDYYSSDMIASHILGSINSDYHGVSGIEAAYDELLYSDKSVSFVYSTDGKGDILKGVAPDTEKDLSVISKGVVTTLDINIQSISEKAANAIESGAVIVADAENSKIRAMVSRPNYNVTETYKYLESENSPLLNRALLAYNVGSAFKPCVAIAAAKAGKSNYIYTCTGSCKIIDRYFKCHKQTGHGLTDLKYGLANSCNTFFYNLAAEIGGKGVYDTASTLRFGSNLKICDGIYTAKGSIPALESLSNSAYLANFSIGQGELLASPVAMLNLYSAITGKGKYYIPSVVEGTLSDGKFTEYNIGNPTKVMTEETADTIKNHLISVITEGTGKTAAPKTVSAAGKTATAQTGKYVNGKEVCQGWFCGFFPAEEPKYIVIVFSENTEKQTLSCNEIFAEIADEIYNLKLEK